MATLEKPSLDASELARVLKDADPTALLVPARLLRRVIKQDRDIGGMGLIVPHRKSYIIDRDSLLQIADYQELGLTANEMPPGKEKVILMVRPESDRLEGLPADQVLVKYWRMLFHARLDLLMQGKLADGTLNAQSVRPRIQQLGGTEFDEIAFVMRQEKFLLPPETPASIYAEFVAVYLTLRRFSDHSLTHFFPCLHDFAAVDALMATEIDVEAVFAGTRLPGAPDPQTLPQRFARDDGLARLSPEPFRIEPPTPVDGKTLRLLEAKATAMDAKGNNVRAAILRTTAAEGANVTPAGARAELARLCLRLQTALELSDADTEKWRVALLPLLARAARGLWSQEARFLYDLQTVCVDSERGIFTVDVVEWVRTFGHRPLKRPLPGHQAVAIVRRLRQALDRMRHVRLADGDRLTLIELLEHAVGHRERLMRERFRPLIAEAMAGVGLKPQNVPEEIGRAKLIEELLDRVVEYGHLNMGNLRDAISRNQLKLPDLSGPAMLVRGDALVRLNRRLSVALDGVYRRGEIYMRLLHRVSSVAFGTAIGRMLVLFLVLPFGLAFFTMVAPSLIVEEVPRIGRMIARVVGLVDRASPRDQANAFAASTVSLIGSPGGNGPILAAAAAFPGRMPEHLHFIWPNLWFVAGIGVFYLLLFHVGGFRSQVFYSVGWVSRGMQTVFIHAPLWVLHHPVLRAILKSRWWVFCRRFVLWPLALAVLAGTIAWLDGLEQASIEYASLSTWAIVLVLLNTRLGRDLEETATDWVMNAWLWCTVDFVPGLLRFIMDVSRGFLETVEQGIYTVDEWLRFQTGQSATVLVAKALLSVIWFAVTYVARIYINVLIEPTVNPIKHFPVVTVGHKIMLPFLVPVGRFLYLGIHLDLLGPVIGYTFVVMTIFFIPGICGFVVWELKENWKLYRANRPANLKPEMIGSHGETMLRLLRTGFHSGTVPKLFRKLRRAERRGQQRVTHKLLAGLHHVEESVAHFVEREMLVLLRQSKGWHGLNIERGAVHLATNRITVALECSELGEEPLILAFDQQKGWLVGSVMHKGWLPQLCPEQKRTLAAALAGVYKMAGVHLTREQIAAVLAPRAVAFDITKEGLVIWPGPDFTSEVAYDLSADEVMTPRPTNGEMPAGMRTLDPSRVLFSHVPLAWTYWVWIWNHDRGLVNGEQRELAYAVLP